MKRFHRFLVAGTFLASAGWLAAPRAAAQPGLDPGRVAAVLAKIDTANLPALGNIAIPPATLAWDALTELAPGDAATTLTGESFVPTADNPQGTTSESTHWVYEWRPQRGAAFLALQEATQMESRKFATSLLGGDARSRLIALGISPQEIGPIAVRRLMTQTRNRETGEVTPPSLYARKVFVQRNIGGIEVLGSRAVFTYGAETDFRKLLLAWPGLVAEGNLYAGLHTPAEVALAVARDLVATDEDDVTNTIPLRWVFDTEPVGPGEVKLLLRAEGTLLDSPSTGDDDPSNEKIRVRLFDPQRANGFFCDMGTSEAVYGTNEQIQITQLRFANHSGAPLPARVRFQIRLPFGLTVNALDLNLTLPDGLDVNLAAQPISLFTVGDQNPALLGGYEVKCSLEDPATGAPIAQDAASFFTQVTGLSSEVE